MNQLLNPKVAGSLYLIAGIILILAQVYKSTHTRSSNWVMYVLGASFILMGIARLRSKPPTN